MNPRQPDPQSGALTKLSYDHHTGRVSKLPGAAHRVKLVPINLLGSGGTSRANESRQVDLGFLQIGVVEVHHVAGGIGIEGDVLQELGVDAEVVERVAGGGERRRQVVIAAGDVDLQEGLAGEGARQGLAHIHIAVVLVPVPRPDRGQDLIGKVGFVLQLVADVIVEGGGEEAGDGLETRVLFHPAAEAVADIALVAAVVAADDAVVPGEEFGGKPARETRKLARSTKFVERPVKRAYS